MEGRRAVSAGLYEDQFTVGGGHWQEPMGMDTEDPVLNSLQTLAEGSAFGEDMEWFE